MKIMNIASVDLWPWGENKGIPSRFAAQKELAGKNHEVYYLCPRATKNNPSKEQIEGINIQRFAIPFGLNFTAIMCMPTHNFLNHVKASVLIRIYGLFFQIIGGFALFNAARKIKPDIIYVHGLTPVFFAAIMRRIFKTKLIVRVYGSRDMYWRRNSLFYRAKDIFDYMAFKVNADYFIITQDGTAADKLAGKMGVDDKKIKCWPNGVDLSITTDKAWAKNKVIADFNINPKNKIIISASRLSPYYNVSSLIYAMPKIIKTNPQISCFITSDGPQRLSLEAAVKTNDLEDNVIFTGMIEHNRLYTILNAADIFVILTPWGNCTNALREAMLCGKCILALDNEEIRKLIDHKQSGYLIKKEDINQLDDVIGELLQKEEFRNALGEAAQKKAKKTFWSWQERMAKETALLEKLVKSDV